MFRISLRAAVKLAALFAEPCPIELRCFGRASAYTFTNLRGG
ncbi:hypothetical protein [Streptomyces arenae]|nr:hypothetical protein [Streptomyces arenae]